VLDFGRFGRRSSVLTLKIFISAYFKIRQSMVRSIKFTISNGNGGGDYFFMAHEMASIYTILLRQ